MKKLNIKNGFTFVELLVVITIIAMIFSAGVVTYTSINSKSRDARRKSDLEAMRQALEMCRSMVSSYPTAAYVYQGSPTASQLSCGASGPVILKTTPYDPISKAAYQYTLNADGSYEIRATMEDESQLIVTSP